MMSARIVRRKSDMEARFRDVKTAQDALYRLQLHPASAVPFSQYQRMLTQLEREAANYERILANPNTLWAEDER